MRSLHLIDLSRFALNAAADETSEKSSLFLLPSANCKEFQINT